MKRWTGAYSWVVKSIYYLDGFSLSEIEPFLSMDFWPVLRFQEAIYSWTDSFWGKQKCREYRNQICSMQSNFQGWSSGSACSWGGSSCRSCCHIVRFKDLFLLRTPSTVERGSIGLGQASIRCSDLGLLWGARVIRHFLKTFCYFSGFCTYSGVRYKYVGGAHCPRDLLIQSHPPCHSELCSFWADLWVTFSIICLALKKAWNTGNNMLAPSKNTSLVSRVVTEYSKSLRFLTTAISLKDKEGIKEGWKKK